MTPQNGIDTLPTPTIPPPPVSKWQREHQAFCRLLPQLLATEPGTYVAIHNEQVIDRDDDESALILRVLAKVGNVDIHVGLVTDYPAPAYRSGVVRDLTALENR